MSLFSKDVLDPIAAFFANVVKSAQGNPASAPALQTTQTTGAKIAQALASADAELAAALPAAATVAVNFVMDMIPGDKAFEPIADAFVQQVIQQLTARKPPAA